MSRYLVATAKDLGDLIRGFRKQRRWTQATLAERAGLLPKTISAIEAGGGQVLLANVMRCLSALDVNVSLDARPAATTMPTPMPTVIKPPTPKSPARRSATDAQPLPSSAKALKERW